ncbi:hypothetical protein NQ315_001829 [Exocentrus adspersus]|uniref:Uncharacterized protein n=1 Tax=Exocentrus adspersus TaxID=1586481 RepID=A0AAV8WAQ5_9CUCU|nr:hypothetical protein NQ315_001829 [Exocentrus adspersus]
MQKGLAIGTLPNQIAFPVSLRIKRIRVHTADKSTNAGTKDNIFNGRVEAVIIHRSISNDQSKWTRGYAKEDNTGKATEKVSPYF